MSSSENSLEDVRREIQECLSNFGARLFSFLLIMTACNNLVSLYVGNLMYRAIQRYVPSFTY